MGISRCKTAFSQGGYRASVGDLFDDTSYLVSAYPANFEQADTDYSATKPTAATYETYPRRHAVSNLTTMSTGRISVVGINLPAGFTVTTITFVSATTAESGGSHLWAALFNSSRQKLAISADDTGATSWAANTAFPFTMTTPYLVPTSGFYYIGVCCVGTVPTSAGISAGVTPAMSLPPVLAGFADSSLTDPASCPSTLSAITAGANATMYGYVA